MIKKLPLRQLAIRNSHHRSPKERRSFSASRNQLLRDHIKIVMLMEILLEGK